MINWWLKSSGWTKYGIPVALLGISTIIFMAGYLWFWGWGAGGAMLLVSLLVSDEKSGWENHDGGEGEEASRKAFEDATTFDGSRGETLCASCDRFNSKYSLCRKFELEVNETVASCEEFEVVMNR